MEDHPRDLKYTAESASLAKESLERHCHATERTDTFLWTSCQDFTVERGKQQIDAYIQTWELQPCWLHTLDFLYSTEEVHAACFYHHYRARFSTPTAREPIADTASVYFLVKVTKNQPPNLPVQVRFIVESNRLVHTAGESRFSEEWLSNVIESKSLVRRTMDLKSSW